MCYEILSDIDCDITLLETDYISYHKSKYCP